MKTTWVIKGVPSYADHGMIIKTLAQCCNQWPGWVVRPKRPLTSTRGKYTTWLVDVAMQPPMSTIMLNSHLISIEKYIEKPAQGAKVNAWFKLKATPRHEITPGQTYQEEYLDADEDGSLDVSGLQKPKSGDDIPPHGGGQAQGYKDVLMSETNAAEERPRT